MNKTTQSVRINIMKSIYHAGSGHPGGALSAVDILTYLFQTELRDNNKDQELTHRFILSKGHACPALYAVGAEVGLIDKSELKNFRKIGSPLQGHTHVKDIPWVETSTGSLGQGFSVAIGMALGLRHKKSSTRVYVMMGDGELQEGEVWEGAMFAGHNQLNNLCGIIDYNKMQSDDLNENIVGLEPLRQKWESFNWNVIEIDGHCFNEIESAFADAKRFSNKPTMIIANTIKGKGVSYMENSPLWHGSVKLTAEDMVKAFQDLGAKENEIEEFINTKQ